MSDRKDYNKGYEEGKSRSKDDFVTGFVREAMNLLPDGASSDEYLRGLSDGKSGDYDYDDDDD